MPPRVTLLSTLTIFLPIFLLAAFLGSRLAVPVFTTPNYLLSQAGGSGSCPTADLNHDGNIDVDDLIKLNDGFAAGYSACPECDINPCPGNKDIDVDDIIAFLEAFAQGAANPKITTHQPITFPEVPTTTSYHYDFGDCITDTGPRVTHIYPTPGTSTGTRTPVATAGTAGGAEPVATVTVTAPTTPPPLKADFRVLTLEKIDTTSQCAEGKIWKQVKTDDPAKLIELGLRLKFDATVSTSPNPIDRYTWYFMDTTAASGAQPIKAFSQSNATDGYNVLLKVSTASGPNSVYKRIYVDEGITFLHTIRTWERPDYTSERQFNMDWCDQEPTDQKEIWCTVTTSLTLDTGLGVLDVSNPAQPTPKLVLPGLWEGYSFVQTIPIGIEVADGKAVVWLGTTDSNDSANNGSIIDVFRADSDDPELLYQIVSTDLPDYSLGDAVTAGDFLYVVARTTDPSRQHKFLVFDLRSAGKPQPLSVMDLPDVGNSQWTITRAGKRSLLLASSSAIWLLDLYNPANPRIDQKIVNAETQVYDRNSFAHGNYFVLNGGLRLFGRVIEGLDPIVPSRVEILRTLTSSTATKVFTPSRGYAYLGSTTEDPGVGLRKHNLLDNEPYHMEKQEGGQLARVEAGLLLVDPDGLESDQSDYLYRHNAGAIDVFATRP